eukprot:g19859.t1
MSKAEAQKPQKQKAEAVEGGEDLPWIEKYRPRTLDEIAHQEEVVKTLKRTLQTANLPHLLFYGPPGTGKTSTILACAKQLFGPTLWRRRVLELNASHERGIQVIRERVKTFAQTAVGTSDNVKGYPCPPYKIIILDEADSMTKDAQSALRRTMEQYTKVTRFCIICNYVSRIIEPIASRCAKFRYKSLSDVTMTERLQQIASAEGVRVGEDALNTLVKVSDGDMRRSINYLQTARRLLDQAAEDLTPEHVVEVAGVIPTQIVSGLLATCKENSFQHIQTAAEDVLAAAYPVDQLLTQLMPEVTADNTIADAGKAVIAIRIAEAEKRLLDGADEYLQLMDVLSYICTTINVPAR